MRFQASWEHYAVGRAGTKKDCGSHPFAAVPATMWTASKMSFALTRTVVSVDAVLVREVRPLLSRLVDPDVQ